jgi:hypothetical protein
MISPDSGRAALIQRKNARRFDGDQSGAARMVQIGGR